MVIESGSDIISSRASPQRMEFENIGCEFWIDKILPQKMQSYLILSHDSIRARSQTTIPPPDEMALLSVMLTFSKFGEHNSKKHRLHYCMIVLYNRICNNWIRVKAVETSS